ncbi:hypothetical protein M067_4654 [Bacteroides fragilis str. J-143-4]|nr:hypothetical protein M067_4654 [Bacteroides fragilis str. J-143-4]
MKEERKRGRCGYNHSISLEATKVLLVIFRRTALLLYFIYDFIILLLLFKFQNVYLFL